MTQICKPPLVIKVGGALLESKDAALSFFRQLNKLSDCAPVLVHGGGAQVQTLLGQLGLESEKRNGVRITPAAHMPIVAGVLAGAVNKQLVAYAQSAGCPALGLSVLDGNILTSEIGDESLGCVGQPIASDPRLLTQLLSQQWLPVVASIGADSKGNLLNINADHAAAAIACALRCPLVLLSDVTAVLDDKKSRIETISHASMTQLINGGVIKDGMQVKVESAMDTAQKTGQPVTIASWKDDIETIIQGQLGTKILAYKGHLL